jgi:vitamin B12 transporter
MRWSRIFVVASARIGGRCAALALAIFFVPAIARAAETPVIALPEIVVTAARIPQPLSAALQSVTVITADDIARSGQQTLIELLQRLGGVEVASAGGAGQTSAVFIRGANSTHTLVLIDGVRIGSATSGATAFENIPLDQIERIEIVAGPLSSLYGSDAIGGVIQIFTKGKRGAPAYGVTAGYGSYNTKSVSGTLNRSVDAVDIALTAGYSDSDQFDATKATIPFDQHNPDRDPYRNANVSGQLVYHFARGDEAGVTVFYSDGKTHFDNGLATDDLNHQQLSMYSIYSRNQIAPAWQSLLRLGRGTDDIVISGQFPGQFRTDSDQATWQNTFEVPGGSLIAGAEYLRQKVTSDTDYTQTSRTIGSGFAGYAGDYGNHGFQANIRYDDNSQFGGHTTGSIGYGYRFDEHWRIRATLGTAFHAPTFNDLYFPFFGNPNLEAERSKSGDIGLDWNSGAQRLSATYFENRISDLIVFDLATFLPQNLDRARIRGGEFAWQGTLAAIEFRAKLTLQQPENEATGSQLSRRAREFGSVVASRAWQQWRFGAEVVASGARFDSNDENPATRMGGYALLNLFASYAFAPGWSTEIRWDNVTNKDYELAKGYNTTGSNVFVWVRWNAAP